MANNTTIDVPARGRKWITGALVRDGMTLYRVAGRPVRYHEDCLPTQRVSKVRETPADWTAVTRLCAIMETVRTVGQHTPSSRGAYGHESAAAECPTSDGPSAEWNARQDSQSHASYPSITVRGDVLRYVEPIYDDSPIVTWLQDSALADEARALIERKLSLTCYPRVRLR